MPIYDDEHTKTAKIYDCQATNPDWDMYYDRKENKWISYSILPGEAYSKQARVIGGISRGYFNTDALDKYLLWKEPIESLVGISSTIEGFSVASHVNNVLVMEYLVKLIPEEYQGSICDIKKKYFSIWKLSMKNDNFNTNEI
jgi:hypothetical protein